uniref:RFLamide n=1 Tax=Tenebrio molitor TaxID=7067 RepID=A0A977SQC7_TENMO|nr:RFLamide [Tenebrio molitor]
MGWYAVIFLLLIRYAITTTGILHSISVPQNLVDEDIHQSVDKIGDEATIENINQYEDVRLEHLGRLLANVLLQPWPKNISPILYVEDHSSESIPNEIPENEIVETEELNSIPFKRSRYYRKYPWKRQNSRYDAENRYLCQPTKEDVFRLLVALHEARQGNRGQIVNFCNRRRPASAIFTNIRFLG